MFLSSMRFYAYGTFIRRRRAGAVCRQSVGWRWETKDPEKQEEVLAGIFYKLVHTLTAHEVPMTFLHFPRFAEDRAADL